MNLRPHNLKNFNPFNERMSPPCEIISLKDKINTSDREVYTKTKFPAQGNIGHKLRGEMTKNACAFNW